MIDHRKIAVPLLLAGAGLAVVSSFLDVYGTGDVGREREPFSTSLWMVLTGRPVGAPDATYYGAGWPVVITAVAMVAGVVLLARERTAFIGRPVALTAAGGLGGVVLFYVLQLRHEEALINAWPSAQRYEIVFHEGTYLLIVAAVAGVVGAVFAQRQQPPPQVDEAEVVVHQLDDGDDTPPFGIAVVELEERQEAR